MMERIFYIDCEFDGHDGPLLSIAMVSYEGRSIHLQTDQTPRDPWVIENVMPIMEAHHADIADVLPLNHVGERLKLFMGDDCPLIVADSPVDIGRFCQAITTSPTGLWASAEYPKMQFEVRNVDCYPTELPGAVQHNAWWDAMALRAKFVPITPPASDAP